MYNINVYSADSYWLVMYRVVDFLDFELCVCMVALLFISYEIILVMQQNAAQIVWNYRGIRTMTMLIIMA